MNCFDWHNRVSDYIDGTLMGSLKSEADQHLESCRECSERFSHYRSILNSIASQPRATLPIPIRKSPLASGLPRLALRLNRSTWDQIPWYLRTTIEGVGIVLMILLGISTGPRLRGIYEKSVETNLEEFTQSFKEWRESRLASNDDIPLLRGKSLSPASLAGGGSGAGGMPAGSLGTGPASETGPADALASGDSESDGGANASAESSSESDEDEGDDSTPVEGGGGSRDQTEVHVGSNEIWRFMLKTDSPHEMRARIVKILSDLHIPTTTAGFGGVEAPGGIQFDILVSPDVIAGLKGQLQAIAPKPPIELADTPAGETFTWYKNKSKTKLPAGKARAVIWLSQM